MHPLELFDRSRRWFDWVLPGRQLWERNPDQVAPNRCDDWLLEPPSLEGRLVCCFLNWMRSGPCFATSNSAWKCGSGMDAVSEHPSLLLLPWVFPAPIKQKTQTAFNARGISLSALSMNKHSRDLF